MNLKQQLAALLAEARGIEKAKNDGGRDFTADEVNRLGEIRAAADDLHEKLKAQLAAAAAVSALAGLDAGVADGIGADDDDVRDRRKALVGGLGDRWIASEAYREWAKANPSGAGQGSPIVIGKANVGTLRDLGRKADPAPLDLATGQPATIRLPGLVDLVAQPPLTLLDLITRGQTNGSFEYLQIVSVTSAAGIVAEKGQKPLSTLGTELADAKVYTYADGYTVTNQMLADAPAVATYLNGRLEYQLNDVVEDKLLNGTGASGEPTGILNTTGVQSQEFDTDMFRSIRKGITKVTKRGGVVTAVLLSPEDDEAWDLAQDDNGRYYSGGPFTGGPNTAWGRPRVVSQKLEPGQSILGDFRTVALLDREGLSVQAFNQHEDYARRNLTYVRAELRAAQAIFEPARLCVIETAGAAGGGEPEA